MPTHRITAVGFPPFDAEEGVRLVLALERNGVDVSHRCGGEAKCTTCRVRFITPEPPIGEVEHQSLEEDGVLGEFRLSCQIRVDRDMEVEVLRLASVEGWDPGPTPEDW
jgi:ferredoxin